MDEEGIPGPRIPVATYRLQFNGGFGFSDARRIVPYLHDLGISDIYASPYLKARKGSPHGYDIVDPHVLNPEVGTEEEYEDLAGELRRRGMGQILDIVPNHMCADTDNPWWRDVLENGRSSPYETFFEIDWEPAVRRLSGRLLIPILGDQYGRVLERGELRLAFENGGFFIAMNDQRFPVMPETYLLILQHRAEELRIRLPEADPQLAEFQSIVTALTRLPPAHEQDGDRIHERYREKEAIKKRLADLCRKSATMRNFVLENVTIFNGKTGEPKSFDLLEGLLDRQVWKLSNWRVATDEINYRRFFDINNIAAIRMQEPSVFEETHGLIFALVKEGHVTGLRVDHPDGLYDPSQYFRRLQRGCLVSLRSKTGSAGRAGERLEPDPDPDVMAHPAELLASDAGFRPFYVIAEKVLTRGENMPEDWLVYGSTGYGFLNSLNGIFVESGNGRLFDALYAQFSGVKGNFSDLVYEKKKLVMQVAMSGEINTLGRHLSALSERHRHTRDFTVNSLTMAIIEVIALYPVYRAYTNSLAVKGEDRPYLESAVSKARRKNPALSASIFDFLGDVLLLKFPDAFREDDRKEWLDFVMGFQQMSAPVMAKGLEDTVFYVYNRLVSLNEVGGSPDRFGQSLEAFHGQNIDRLKFWPHALSATSTHDTKRSEDVRARINVLSEIPEEWRKCLQRWSLLNKRKKTVSEGHAVPDRNEEYLLYQTLVGAWPLGSPDAGAYETFRTRIREYMVKAVREAKVNTSWINPDVAYEGAVASFVDEVLADTPDNRFLQEFLPFQKRIAHYGMLNSLSQTLLKIASPGVPDFFQGTEVWDFSLVDPDNRRHVDFDTRQHLLGALREREKEYGPGNPQFTEELLQTWEDGRLKLHVTAKALACRKQHHAAFMSGAYLPLATEGERKEKLCAFSRVGDATSIVVVVPRLLTSFVRPAPDLPLGSRAWGDTALTLPDDVRGRIFRNALTGEGLDAGAERGRRVLVAADIFRSLPLALLVSAPA